MAADTEQDLQLLDESFTNALAIVAHPDDLEFGAAAAIARWTKQGKHVRYCMVTSGEAGIDSLPPNQCKTVREEEQRESAKIVGVDDVDFLGFPDGTVTYSLELRSALALNIRRFQPEVIITLNFHRTFGGKMLNQADHMAVGTALIDAARDAGNRWIFTEQLADDLEPWTGVKQIWVSSSPYADHGIDVTETFALGVDSLQAHSAYLDGIGWSHSYAENMLRDRATAAGKRLGVTFGAAFEVIPMTLEG